MNYERRIWILTRLLVTWSGGSLQIFYGNTPRINFMPPWGSRKARDTCLNHMCMAHNKIWQHVQLWNVKVGHDSMTGNKTKNLEIKCYEPKSYFWNSFSLDSLWKEISVASMHVNQKIALLYKSPCLRHTFCKINVLGEIKQCINLVYQIIYFMFPIT